ncbi:oxygen-dependent coproporphyrinogen oxidase [soil metagenome]
MTRRDRVYKVMQEGQAKLVAAFEKVDARAKFEPYTWDRPGGGGGRAMALQDGAVFEKAGVNVSAVQGDKVPPSLAAQHPGTADKPWFATGISLVLHPQNPYVPAFHANYRYFEVGAENETSDVWWFGGGVDMTSSYPFEEDVVHFHRTLQAQCERHPQADYETFKKTCDTYFYIKHRFEMRGVGGIFFDELSPVGQWDWEADLAHQADGIDTILSAYLPIVEKRKDMLYGEREKQWQHLRRGRYAEFNLVYDRGTLFGLQTTGNIEAILMSMPPLARWAFDFQPEPGSDEAKVLEYLQPRDWA